MTADLESPLAKVKMDIQRIPFPDGEFDVIFCNHILEHVDDDRRAMREMYRVMRPGRMGHHALAGQHGARDDLRGPVDHRPRGAGAAFRTERPSARLRPATTAGRLSEAGFDVEEIDYVRSLSPEAVKLYGLRSEIVYVVRKPSGRAGRE